MLAEWTGRAQRFAGVSRHARLQRIDRAFLVYLFAIGHLGGVLLWPGVVLHAVVALLLIWTGRRARQSKAGIQ